ncbi:MAG TPA: LLM class flavin-dependent oxidoreductase [Acidimicrobiales bacterium]|nr:LLM class flavin-dependent oxidoreductase [Acidimicrobiales bacterium]
MRLGVVILPDRRWRDAAAIWREVEAIGFEHGWTYDHLAWGSLRDSAWFAAFPTLAAAAGVTSRIRLGTLVASPNFRHPVPLAREVLALDDISEGRFELGIGAGGGGWDATILGGPPWTAAERSARFAEFVELTDLLLSERRVSYSGSYYSAEEARSYPGCIQAPRVPFVVGGTGPKAMAVVARFGDAWVTTGPRHADGALDAEMGARAVAEQLDLLEAACGEIGRNAGQLRRIALLGPTLAQEMSSAAQFEDSVERYEAAGVTELIVHWPREDGPYRGDRRSFETAVAGSLRR